MGNTQKMLIDLTIIYDGKNMTVKSEAAKSDQTKPATIGFSKAENEIVELIEGIGENWTTADLQQMALIERGQDNHTYRVINPFSIESFEPLAAYMTVRFYYLKTHYLIKPKTYQFRALLGIDKFHITLKIPKYKSIAIDKREIFERELKKITKHLVIE